MLGRNYPTIVTCHFCKEFTNLEYTTLYDLTGHGYEIVHRCDACAEKDSPTKTPTNDIQPIDTLKGKLAVAFAIVSAVMFAFGFYIASAIAASNAIAGGR